MSEKPLRWGVISAGAIANDFTLAMEKSVHPHVVVAVAVGNGDPQRAAKFAAEHKICNGAKPYGSYEELIKDPHVDVIYVGSHNETHCPLVKKCVEAGKAVLCEKPFGLNVQEVRETLELAKSKGVFVMEAFWSRFFPVWKEIRRIIQSKELGEPRLAEVRFGQQLPDKFRQLDVGNTPTMMFGCYTFMFTQFIFGGKPRKMHITGEVNPKNGIEEWVSAVLDYGEDRQGHVYYHSRHWLPQAAFICFDKGQITLPDHFWCPERLIRVDDATQEGVIWIEEKDRKKLEFPFNDDRKFIYNHSTGLRYEADHVYEQLRKGAKESDLMPHDDSIAVAEMLAEVNRQLGVKPGKK